MAPNLASRETMVRWWASNALDVLPTYIFRIVPNYDLPPNLSDVDILRVVVKENCTEALVDRLVCDIVCLHFLILLHMFTVGR